MAASRSSRNRSLLSSPENSYKRHQQCPHMTIKMLQPLTSRTNARCANRMVHHRLQRPVKIIQGHQSDQVHLTSVLLVSAVEKFASFASNGPSTGSMHFNGGQNSLANWGSTP